MSATISHFHNVDRSVRVKLTSFPFLSDGNDGPWSSFTIQAGSPPQSVRVLVSTSLAETWFISASIDQSRCLATDPPGCVQSRGGLFSTNSSTSWQHKGLYELGLAEVFGNHIGNCEIEDYGSDAIELSLAGSSSVRSDSQTIATIATEDVDLGFLGISNRRNHFTSLSRGQGSFLESMKASGNIPSLSYAYSAGAQYRKALKMIVAPFYAKSLQVTVLSGH